MSGTPLPAASARLAAEARLAERRLAPILPCDAPLAVVAVAVGLGAVGAIVGAPLDVRPEFLASLSAVVLGVWFVEWRLAGDGGVCRPLLTAVALLAAAWAGASWRTFRDDEVGRFAPEDRGPVAIEVVALGMPRHYAASPASPFRAIPAEERTVLVTRATSLRDGVAWRPVSGRCQLTVAGRRLEGITPGTRLLVFGQLSAPPPARNPGETDARRRARAERCLAWVWTEAPECLAVAAREDPGPMRRLVSATQRWAADSVERRFDPDIAPLARAVALGEIGALGEEVLDAFRKTGTIHLLVVSGFHVALVAGLLPGLAALGLAPRRGAWAAALGLASLYVAVVGAEPPALRAGVVVAALAVAAAVGRRAAGLNSFGAAAVAVFAASPGAWLAPGTRLSFLAAGTLLACGAYVARRRAKPAAPIDRLIESARSPAGRLARRWVRGMTLALGASLAVQGVVGPMVASEFHMISPAAAPLSLLAGPLLSATLVACLATLLFDAAAALAAPIGAVAWSVGLLADAGGAIGSIAAAGFERVVTSAAELPAAGFWVAGPPAWWPALWVGWLATAALVALYAPRYSPAVTRLGLATIAAAFVGPLAAIATRGDALRCSFLAVGHGAAVLLEPASGGAVLVDAGALADPERVADTVARALWARGVHRLDAVIVTHADSDHYNALPGLLERMPIDVVFTTTRTFPSVVAADDRSGPAELWRRLADAGVSVRTLVAGDRLPLGETVLEVLHPDDVGVADTDNANSLVLGVEHRGRRVLLPGDLEGLGLRRLLAQEPFDCDVLLAPHHGSAASDPEGFAAWCRPEHVILSSGQPRETTALSYRESGAGVVSTHDAGMVTTELGPSGVSLSVFRR